METRLRELEERLKKSEDQRQKLKDNLKFFKEKATNTQELLLQHAQLQDDAERKDKELSQLRMARQGLQAQLEAGQATLEAAASAPLGRQGSSSCDPMKAIVARLDRVQQISQDAKAASQAAAAAARRAEYENLNLQRQNAQLRDRIKELEMKQKASAEELGRVKVQGAALCERQHLERKVTGLEQQLLALLQQQRHGHEQLSQWQQAFGAFAQHIAPPQLGSTPVSAERQAGNGMDSLEPQHRKEQDRPLKRFCRDAGRLDVKDSSRGSVPYRPEPISDAVGTAMHMASGSEGDRTSTGTVAGPDGNASGIMSGLPAVQAITHTPLQECSSSRAVACHQAVLPGCHATARNQFLQHPQPGKALESSSSGNAAERDAIAPLAMDLVESWLLQLLDRGQPAEMCSTVAAGLAAAVSSDACLVPCIIAGFESTLLRSVSAPERRLLSSHAVSSDTVSAGIRIAGSQHMVQPEQSSGVHEVLLCAVELDQRLNAAGSQQECLLTLLERQLHQASLQEEDAWETEACILAAAAAHLYRLQHKEQALHVLLYDMLMSQEEANAQLLLRVSAAVLAWPLPLHRVASSADDLLGQAVLATIRDMCTRVLSMEERHIGDAETAADTDSGTSSAMNVNTGVQRAARALSKQVLPEMHQAAAGSYMEQTSAGEWSGLKGVLEDALRKGLAMAEHAKQDSAAEDQWHALACTIQLAVRCLGISHCTEKAKEHGILDTLKAIMHPHEVPMAAGKATGTASRVAAEVELIQ